jgi:hypothetical protein
MGQASSIPVVGLVLDTDKEAKDTSQSTSETRPLDTTAIQSALNTGNASLINSITSQTTQGFAQVGSQISGLREQGTVLSNQISGLREQGVAVGQQISGLSTVQTQLASGQAQLASGQAQLATRFDQTANEIAGLRNLSQTQFANTQTGLVQIRETATGLTSRVDALGGRLEAVGTGLTSRVDQIGSRLDAVGTGLQEVTRSQTTLQNTLVQQGAVQLQAQRDLQLQLSQNALQASQFAQQSQDTLTEIRTEFGSGIRQLREDTTMANDALQRNLSAASQATLSSITALGSATTSSFGALERTVLATSSATDKALQSTNQALDNVASNINIILIAGAVVGGAILYTQYQQTQ